MNANRILTLITLLALLLVSCNTPADSSLQEKPPGRDSILGRWDVTVETSQGSYPCWCEIQQTDGELEGSFVGQVGSARPMTSVSYRERRLSFQLPVQYERHATDLSFEGNWRDGSLFGTTRGEEGTVLQWTAARAPELAPPPNVSWGEPVQLFNGNDLTGWKPRHPDARHYWSVENGLLVNTDKGADLMTEGEYQDFKLRLEFRYPEGSNSGVYLRGRYEVQIQDDYGKEPSNIYLAGVYGFLAPSVNAGRRAGEWQSYEITLLGRYITVVLNGQTVIQDREIPGITGGALDSHEGEPGPILLQGDHGPISLRYVELIPALADSNRTPGAESTSR